VKTQNGGAKGTAVFSWLDGLWPVHSRSAAAGAGRTSDRSSLSAASSESLIKTRRPDHLRSVRWRPLSAPPI